ncbi:tRNA 2-thiouridine(34) synthase MnmA [candidate division WWE3 bacterium]|uniref:tRNA-specific 2-thiouridylase MnmA n=1 Tax=candidate division WWE3 bacterium TaxID=2053526 RepID=A0A7X9HH14_UNCKA|nr:tRNA 2-thiouridine(34) synthase MnmA [candidate division WWE3 bacterium]
METIIPEKKKIALGLSGGVDSSVAAYLLREQGYDVTGVYIQCWEKESDGCASDEDKAYALQSAAKLGIKFTHLNFIDRYKSKVIEYFYSEYAAGRTPNPDVMCNKEIKFGIFYDWAMEQGFDYVATGHYARISKDVEDPSTTKYLLKKGLDQSKDQSYFLYLLDQEHLAKTLLPIGDLQKTEVRQIAARIKLPTAQRPDSMGVCFIGEVDIKDFLKQRLPEKTGNIVNKSGEVIGTHEGSWFYTIGQRHGFKVTKYSGKPMYIIGKNSETNELLVGFEEDVYSDSFTVINPHWISQSPFKPNIRQLHCTVRIRHLGQIYDCVVGSGENLTIKTEKPVFAIAPGQSAVFYDGDTVLGGAIIDKVAY